MRVLLRLLRRWLKWLRQKRQRQKQKQKSKRKTIEGVVKAVNGNGKGILLFKKKNRAGSTSQNSLMKSEGETG